MGGLGRYRRVCQALRLDRHRFARLIFYPEQIMKYHYEMTDTFGGEANYSWARRGELELPEGASDLMLVRRVKKALGLENVPCKREECGDQIALYPIGSCTVVFIG